MGFGLCFREEGLSSSWTSYRIGLGEKGRYIRAKTRTAFKVRASLRLGLSDQGCCL